MGSPPSPSAKPQIPPGHRAVSAVRKSLGTDKHIFTEHFPATPDNVSAVMDALEAFPGCFDQETDSLKLDKIAQWVQAHMRDFRYALITGVPPPDISETDAPAEAVEEAPPEPEPESAALARPTPPPRPQSRLADMTAEIDRLKTEITGLEDRLKVHEESWATAAEAMGLEVEEGITEAVTEGAGLLKTSRDLLVEERDRLKSEVEALGEAGKDGDQLKERIEDLAQIEEERDQLKIRVEALGDVEQERDRLKEQAQAISQIEEERDQLKVRVEALSNLEVERDQLKDEVRKLSFAKQERDQFKDRVEVLSKAGEERDQLEKQVEALTMVQEERDQLVQQVEALSKAKEERDQLEKQVKALTMVQEERDQLVQQVEEFSTLKQERDQLKEQIDALSVVKEERDQLTRKVEAFSKIEEELDKVQRQVEALSMVQEERDQLMKQLESFAEVRGERDRLRDQVEALSQVQEDRDQLEERIKTISGEQTKEREEILQAFPPDLVQAIGPDRAKADPVVAIKAAVQALSVRLSEASEEAANTQKMAEEQRVELEASEGRLREELTFMMKQLEKARKERDEAKGG